MTNPAIHSVKSARRLWFSLGAAMVLLVALISQKFLGPPLRRTFPLNSFEQNAGVAAHYTLPREYSKNAWTQRLVRIYEDGTPLPHRIPSGYGTPEEGNGCFQVNLQRVWFVGLDGSDPRTNGRHYVLTAPRLVPSWLIWLAAITVVAEALCVIFCRTTRAQLRQAAKAARRWLSAPYAPDLSGRMDSQGGGQNRAGPVSLPDRLCLLVSKNLVALLAIPSIFILAGLPPLWRDIDGVVQLTFPAGPTTILHFPPLYCFGARVPLVIGETFGWFLANGPRPEWRIWEGMRPTAAGVYGILLAQHALLWLVLAAFIRSVTRSPRLQTLFAVIALSCAPFYTVANSIGSESGSMLLLLLFCMVCIKLSRRQAPRWLWPAYAAALFCCILTRHINAVFAMALPLNFALAAGLVFLFRRRDAWKAALARHGKAAVLATAAGVISIVAANLTLRALCFAVQIDYHADIGETLADRLAPFLRHLSEPERRSLEAIVLGRTSDPGTREAIRALAEVGAYYPDGGEVTVRFLEKSARLHGMLLELETKKRFDAATVLYLKTLHPELASEIRDDFFFGVFHASVADLAAFPMGAHLWLIEVRSRDTIHSMLKPLARFDETAAVDSERLVQWEGNPYVRLDRQVSAFRLFAAAALIGILSLFRKPFAADRVGLAFSLMLSGAVSFFLTMGMTLFMVRYAMPMFLMGIAALFLSMTALFERRRVAADGGARDVEGVPAGVPAGSTPV